MDSFGEGFVARTVVAGGRKVACEVGGPAEAPAVLLLHGFPQTRLAWRAVAARLSRDYRVVCPDLPGYGESERLGDGPEAFAKRRTAGHLVEVMREFGHERFGVVGHDRGALVATRIALDHPERVDALAVVDVVPTADLWPALAGVAGVFAFHLYLLASPPDLPERMIAADPDVFFGHFLDSWTKVPDAIPAPVREHYLRQCARPEVILAICDDYRASAFIDPEHEEADRAAGTSIAAPTLAVWQDPGDMPLPFDPEVVWSRWAPDLRTLVLPTGHFIPEEAPEELAAAVSDLLTH
ncbi:alpha/beta hydrolase [Kribbella sp. NPDC020789]